MIARTGDWIGSAPVAGTRTNGQRTVSGRGITVAINSANKKAASNIQAVERMIHGGGSCGNISDSASSEPRWVNCEVIEKLPRCSAADWKGNNTTRGVPSAHHGCQSQQCSLLPRLRWNALRGSCSTDPQ